MKVFFVDVHLIITLIGRYIGREMDFTQIVVTIIKGIINVENNSVIHPAVKVQLKPVEG